MTLTTGDVLNYVTKDERWLNELKNDFPARLEGFGTRKVTVEGYCRKCGKRFESASEWSLFCSDGCQECHCVVCGKLFVDHYMIVTCSRKCRDAYTDAKGTLLNYMLKNMYPVVVESLETSEPQKSFVYFIRAETTGRIKIGVSVNVENRLGDLQSASPDRLEVLHYVNGDFDLEQMLHERFKHLRVKGEWFDPGDDLLTFIDELKQNCEF